MVEYKCDLCKKVFKKKYAADSHANRKNPCNKQDIIDRTCFDCGKVYYDKYYAKDHRLKCKSKKESKKESKNKMNKIKNTNNINITNNNTNNTMNITNNNNNNIYNINIKPFGKNCDDINQKEVIDFLSKGCMCIEMIIEKVHFSGDHPEYHNVYISNYRSGMALIFDGNNFVTINKQEIIDTLCDDK